jgi:Fic family protein
MGLTINIITMVSIKEKTVKGKTYIYVSTSVTYKGERKFFEKYIGPKNMNKKQLAKKIDFYARLLSLKKDFYKDILITKSIQLKHLPKKYAFLLTMISSQYEEWLSKFYPTELKKYRQDFDVRYVHNTTAIEGNTISLRETGLILYDNIAPKGKKLHEIHEIENYKNVLQYVRTYKKDLNLNFILTLHKLIQRNIDDDAAGTLRRAQIYIRDSNWTPPPAFEVEDRLKDLIMWYNKNKKKYHPFEVSGIIHHRFLQIHPFADGNGRVAREILNFILGKNGYPPIIIPVKERQDYMENLEKADEGDIQPLLEFQMVQLLRGYRKVSIEYFEKNKDDFTQKAAELDQEEIEELKDLFQWLSELLKEFNIKPADIGIDLDI